jgi:heme/copper-type cytochrome/quinol oxidase subunit 3
LSSLFISLQIKEFRILALSINDSLYSSLFFFLTGLHFFHLSIGLILLIYFWCSRSSFIPRFYRSCLTLVTRLSLPSTSLRSVPDAQR